MKDCIQQIRECGDAHAHECSSVNVGPDTGLLGTPCEPDELASRMTKVQFVLVSRLAARNVRDCEPLTSRVFSKLRMGRPQRRRLHVDRGRRRISVRSQVSCRLVETRAKWP